MSLICCVGNMQILLDNMAYADDDEALQDGDVRYQTLLMSNRRDPQYCNFCCIFSKPSLSGQIRLL